MKAGEVDQGQVIKDLLFDIKSLKQEDILTDKHKNMLAEAENLLLEARNFIRDIMRLKPLQMPNREAV
jgi:hypothetical protein